MRRYDNSTRTQACYKVYPASSPYPMGDAVVYRNKVDIPATTKRIKPTPLQLFTSSTERTTTSSTTVDTGAGVDYRLGGIHEGAAFVGVGSYFYGADATSGTGFNGPEIDWNPLYSQLRLAVKDQKLNLGVAVAELPKTAEMVSRIALDVVKFVRRARSGRALSDVVKALKQPRSKWEKRLADQWLQYRYGIQPLVSDVNAAMDDIARGFADGRVYHYVTARCKSEREYAGSLQGSTFNFPAYARIKCLVRYKAVARYQLQSSSVKTATQLGLTNPALLLWEVTPFSFVFDWVIPVGDWLNGLDALVGVGDFYMRKGYRATWQTQTFHKGEMPYGYHNARKLYRGGIEYSIPLPKLQPAPHASVVRAITSIALLKQVLGGRRT